MPLVEEPPRLFVRPVPQRIQVDALDRDRGRRHLAAPGALEGVLLILVADPDPDRTAEPAQFEACDPAWSIGGDVDDVAQGAAPVNSAIASAEPGSIGAFVGSIPVFAVYSATLRPGWQRCACLGSIAGFSVGAIQSCTILSR